MDLKVNCPLSCYILLNENGMSQSLFSCSEIPCHMQNSLPNMKNSDLTAVGNKQGPSPITTTFPKFPVAGTGRALSRSIGAWGHIQFLV